MADASTSSFKGRALAGLRFFAAGLPIALVDGAKLLVPALTTMRIGSEATDATPLAAMSLGVLTFNVAGNMIMTAPLSAMDTIAPQAFGAGNVVGVGLTAQRALITGVAFLLPTTPLWIFASKVLVAFGQPPDVATLAQTNMLLLLPGLFPFAVFEVGRKYVYAQGIQWPPVPAACLGLASHMLWQELISRAVGPSFVPFAPCLTFATMALLLVLLIRYALKPAARAAWPSGRFQQRLLWRDRKAWATFLKASFAYLLSLTEWLFWEFVCFRVGALGVLPLAAYTVGYSLEPCFFMLAIGLSTALSNAVGNALGAEKLGEARRVCLTGFSVGYLTVILYVGAAWLAQNGLIHLFTHDEAVAAAAVDMWRDWCVFMLVSGGFALMLGLVKGLGLQKQLAVLVVLGLWPLGAPLVWVADSPSHVWRMLAITYTCLIVAMGVLAGCSDWRKLSKRAVENSRSSGDADTDGTTSTGAARSGGLAAADSAAVEIPY